MTVHAKRGFFAYATEIAFLISFERVSKVLATGAIGSVSAVMDPKLRHFETEPLQTQYVAQPYFRLVNIMMTS